MSDDNQKTYKNVLHQRVVFLLLSLLSLGITGYATLVILTKVNLMPVFFMFVTSILPPQLVGMPLAALIAVTLTMAWVSSLLLKITSDPELGARYAEPSEGLSSPDPVKGRYEVNFLLDGPVVRYFQYFILFPTAAYFQVITNRFHFSWFAPTKFLSASATNYDDNVLGIELGIIMLDLERPQRIYAEMKGAKYPTAFKSSWQSDLRLFTNPIRGLRDANIALMFIAGQLIFNDRPDNVGKALPWYSQLTRAITIAPFMLIDLTLTLIQPICDLPAELVILAVETVKGSWTRIKNIGQNSDLFSKQMLSVNETGNQNQNKLTNNQDETHHEDPVGFKKPFKENNLETKKPNLTFNEEKTEDPDRENRQMPN